MVVGAGAQEARVGARIGVRRRQRLHVPHDLHLAGGRREVEGRKTDLLRDGGVEVVEGLDPNGRQHLGAILVGVR